MRHLHFISAATLGCVVLAAQAQEKPDACQKICTPAQAQRLGVLSNAIEVCDVSNQHKCKQKVNVTVEDGHCVSRLRYCVLCVVTGSDSLGRPKFLPTLEWTIDGHGKYRFVQANGVEIKNSSAAGKEHFKNPSRVLPRKYTWDTSMDPSPPGQHGHEAYVYDRDTGEQCIPKDPFIVNTEN
jgi:hypothetical protein